MPNALTFLDKYSQVPWILNPILQVNYVSPRFFFLASFSRELLYSKGQAGVLAFRLSSPEVHSVLEFMSLCVGPFPLVLMSLLVLMSSASIFFVVVGSTSRCVVPTYDAWNGNPPIPFFSTRI